MKYSSLTNWGYLLGLLAFSFCTASLAFEGKFPQMSPGTGFSSELSQHLMISGVGGFLLRLIVVPIWNKFSKIVGINPIEDALCDALSIFTANLLYFSLAASVHPSGYTAMVIALCTSAAVCLAINWTVYSLAFEVCSQIPSVNSQATQKDPKSEIVDENQAEQALKEDTSILRAWAPYLAGATTFAAVPSIMIFSLLIYSGADMDLASAVSMSCGGFGVIVFFFTLFGAGFSWAGNVLNRLVTYRIFNGLKSEAIDYTLGMMVITFSLAAYYGETAVTLAPSVDETQVGNFPTNGLLFVALCTILWCSLAGVAFALCKKWLKPQDHFEIQAVAVFD